MDKIRDYESRNDSDMPDYEYDNDAVVVRYDKNDGGFHYSMDCDRKIKLKQRSHLLTYTTTLTQYCCKEKKITYRYLVILKRF